MTKVTRFEQGVAIRLVWVIDGETYPMEAFFTGKGTTINGLELGEFQNVNSSKTYLLSLEGLSKMQGEEWDEPRDSFGE